MRNIRVSYWAALVLAAAMGAIIFAECAEAARWQVVHSAYFKFFYCNTAGRRIALTMANRGRLAIEPYRAAKQVLGTSGLNATFWRRYGKIRVLIVPQTQYDRGGYRGSYSWSGTTGGLYNETIKIWAGTRVNERTVRNYATCLAHETSHLMFMNSTKLYQNDWFWNSSSSGFYWVNYLTEALAYYTGGCYYRFGPRYSKSTIRSRIRGYNVPWATTGYRYVRGGFTSQDWWQFHAIGWFLTHHSGGLKRVHNFIRDLRTYRKSSYVFDYAYSRSYGKIAYHWSNDRYDSRYLYYRYYWYWND
ncbi:hypothetical protein ACFL2Q_13485 [Thermodesulfobacteriota bacterium]